MWGLRSHQVGKRSSWFRTSMTLHSGLWEVKPVSCSPLKGRVPFESPQCLFECICVWILSPRWEGLLGARRAYGDMAWIRRALICQNDDLRHRRPQPRPPGDREEGGGGVGGVDECGKGHISVERVSTFKCGISERLIWHYGEKTLREAKNPIFVFVIYNLGFFFFKIKQSGHSPRRWINAHTRRRPWGGQKVNSHTQLWPKWGEAIMTTLAIYWPLSIKDWLNK